MSHNHETNVHGCGCCGHAKEGGNRAMLYAVIFSGVCLSLGLLFKWTNTGGGLAADIFFLAGIVAGWQFILPAAWQALRRGSLDMNVLMTIAVLGALMIHEWAEGAAVVFLFSLSEFLEMLSTTRARKSVQELMKLAPETAWVKDGDDFREVPVEQVEAGSVITVKSGMRVPLDGVIVGGEGTLDQSPITGESLPVEKKPGDTVFAGTINGATSLEIRTTKIYADTTITHIIHLIEEAQSQKAPIQRFVDVFARYYTPAVIVSAAVIVVFPPLLFAASWGDWFYRGLVMLVIACPCALVISTPVSIISGLTALARRGVLVKGGAALETLGRLSSIALDKTGTITEGRPAVTKIVALGSFDEKEILRIAASLDVHSEHPLAKAIVAYAQKCNIAFSRCDAYRAHQGRGAEGILAGHHYFVGNHRYTHEMALCSPHIEALLAEIETDAQSVTIVGHMPHDDCKGEVLGILAIGDTVRENAVSAIASLHRAGVKKIVMLSGDNQRTVNAIAHKVGIDEAHGDLLPEQKIACVRALLAESHCVAMLGDGVNDAPAMAVAAMGIAMGAGTDAALETADMVLIENDLSKVAEAIRLGRRTLRIIQANITFALALKAAFLLLALTGCATLWAAIAADTGATLLVIANSLRLMKNKAG